MYKCIVRCFMKNFKEIIAIARNKGPKTIAVAVAHDEDVLKAVKAAVDKKIVKAILIGEKTKIIDIAGEINLNLNDIDVIDILDESEASFKAVELVSTGKADI